MILFEMKKNRTWISVGRFDEDDVKEAVLQQRLKYFLVAAEDFLFIDAGIANGSNYFDSFPLAIRVSA